MTTVRRYLFLVLLASAAVAALWNCGGDSSTERAEGDTLSDSVLIQKTFNEVITRWHNRDKAVLYDNEFEYLQTNTTFDEYLKFGQIDYLEADTVIGMNVGKIDFYGERDSAMVHVQIVFQGPTGRVSYDVDRYKLYWHRGKWIRPTVSDMAHQLDWENLRRQADSAADAEASQG